MSPTSPRLAVARPASTSACQSAKQVVALHMRQDHVLVDGVTRSSSKLNSARRDRPGRASGPTVASPGMPPIGFSEMLTMRVAGDLCAATLVRAQRAKAGFVRFACLERLAIARQRLEGRRREIGRDPLRVRRRRRRRSARACGANSSSTCSREFFGAELVDQDLDARLVLVVAPAMQIVDAHDRFEIGEQLVLAAGSRGPSCRSSACGPGRRRPCTSQPVLARVVADDAAGRCRAP